MLEQNLEYRKARLFEYKLDRLILAEIQFDPTKMSLATGDLAVVDDIFSYQQYNRLLTNFSAATLPANRQPGSVNHDIDTDFWWGRNAADTDDYLLFSEKTGVHYTNLLSNSALGVWSQSDASKGLATITYDTGAKGAGTAPSVGDAVVGANGATAKLISYTTASGTWAGGNAAGVLTVGAVSHDFAFVDNEVLTFDGVETAAVNMPDSADQVGLIQNGGFATDTDPPPGWNAAGAATLTTEIGGQVGNCGMVANTGAAASGMYQGTGAIVTIGKIYKVSLYVKKGTSATFSIQVGTAADSGRYALWSGLSDAAWTMYSVTFEAAETNIQIKVSNESAVTAETTYIDEVTCYEITPCCTAVNTLAFDGGWGKVATCDIYREHPATNTKDGSFYSLKMVPGAATNYVFFKSGSEGSEEWIRQFEGRTVTLGAWVKTSTASHAYLSLQDVGGTGIVNSSFHTGGGAWEWLEVTSTFGASIAELYFFIRTAIAPAVNGDTIVYISQPQLVFGSSIGEGNFLSKQGEWIHNEKPIPFSTLNNKTGLSDVAFTNMNVESESEGLIPKGAKALLIGADINDSGSAATDCYLVFRKDATLAEQLYFSPYGLANDAIHRGEGIINLDVNGDLDYKIEASGAGTLDVTKCKIYAVKVN